MKKKILLWFGTVIATIFMGFVLINLAYLIDTESMQANLKESQVIFEYEGSYPRADNSVRSVLDNFTDAWMLLTAGYNGEESTLDQAMNNYRYEIKGKDPAKSLARIKF